MKTKAYAAHSHTSPMTPYELDRRNLLANDVAIEILYCGVCHSDLHTVRNDWGETEYPIVPGHEIIGRVTGHGPDVTKYQTGDLVAVGCLVDSCMECDQCQKGEEQLCRHEVTETYASPDRLTGAITQGGYSKHIVVREEFVLRVPEGLDIAKAGPLLCAGITTWSPLRTWGVTTGSRVGVVGLGGLGHMAVKLAAALGAHVTVISRSDSKRDDAMALGADALLVSTDADAMDAAADSFDLIIDTVPVKHDIMPYVPLLDIDATLVLVGQLGPLETVDTMPIVAGRRRISGSPMGGIRETQALLDFCAANNVHPDVEMIRMDQINEAFERLEKADVRYRFVIDMATL
ncbi:MAG: hydroxyacid dehydrogenase [Oceanospirillaceae bacterium]|nr:hydroxyacid dehydrogenase [Oceanospirillaceae bacterium]|tara:strand:- start:4679 stop:5719 length:1041 start_codon:yes stop_codon:yes gene_type:complete